MNEPKSIASTPSTECRNGSATQIDFCAETNALIAHIEESQFVEPRIARHYCMTKCPVCTAFKMGISLMTGKTFFHCFECGHGGNTVEAWDTLATKAQELRAELCSRALYRMLVPQPDPICASPLYAAIKAEVLYWLGIERSITSPKL